MIASWRKSDNKPRRCVENWRHCSADKGPYSKGYGLPSGHVWLWELDHKKGRMLKNWCLKTVVLKKTLESPLDSEDWQQGLTAKFDNKPVNLEGYQPEYSMEGLMLKLKLQYFGHLMHTDYPLEKSLMLGKIEGRRRRGHQRMRWLDSNANAMNINLGKLQEVLKDREAWPAAVFGSARARHALVTEQHEQQTFGFTIKTLVKTNAESFSPCIFFCFIFSDLLHFSLYSNLSYFLWVM